MKRNFLVLVLIFAVSTSAFLGCGGGKKEEKKTEEFKIPDSLLSPLSSYGLTRDDYHPIEGGVMANPRIELHYPASPIARFIAVKTFGIAKEAYRKVNEAVGRPCKGRVVLIGAKDLDEYRFLTKKEWWYYGFIAGDTIYFEPFDIMLKRGIAEMGITQKLAQLALLNRSGGRIPLWMCEALASKVADEGEILKVQANEFRYNGMILDIPPEKVEKALREAESRPDTRIAYFAAYRMLENLLSFSKMDDVLKFVDMLGDGADINEASRKVFGMDYGTLLDRVRVDRG